MTRVDENIIFEKNLHPDMIEDLVLKSEWVSSSFPFFIYALCSQPEISFLACENCCFYIKLQNKVINYLVCGNVGLGLGVFFLLPS